LRASRNIVYAGLYTPDGRPLAEYWRDGTGKTPPLARNAIPQTENHFFTGDEVAVLHPIAHEGKPIDYVEELPALRIFTDFSPPELSLAWFGDGWRHVLSKE
jgi:hypothetical protein